MKPSVQIRLHGGLGNQLFQYATGRAVALGAGCDLVLDTRILNLDGPFQYSLQHFAIEARIGSADELPPARDRLFAYLLWRYGGGKPRFLRERGLGFNPAVAAAGPGTYLHGYFQTERYFRAFDRQIRQELSIVTPPDAANAALLEEIAAVPAVSLHVRRGDYVASQKAGTAHGTCSPAYYQNAVSYLADHMGVAPVVFVFSDDPAWVGENLALPFERRIVDANDFSRNYQDLRLMAACRHHVIANSTFSWWGAWLNPDPAKIVVAPKRWFADPKLFNPDICPDDWVRM